MKINNIIKDLLLDGKSVVIEGIGEFKIIHNSAIIGENGKMQPPKNQIVFDTQNTTDYGILTSYLQEKQGISEADAKKQILDFVKATEAKLQMKDELIFDEIGTLYLDSKNKYNIKNIPQNSIFAGNLGMKEIVIPEQKITNIESNKKKDKKVVKATKAVETTEEKKPNKTLKRMLISLPIIILIILAVIFYKDIWNYSNKFAFVQGMFKKTNVIADTTKLNNNVVENIHKDSNNIAKVDTAKNNIVANKDTVKTDEQIIKDSDIETVTPDNLGSEYKNYYLVIGSFKNQKNAKKLRTKMKSKGYNSEILQNRKNYFRVVIGGYDTADKAIEGYQNFVSSKNKEDIWLLINK